MDLSIISIVVTSAYPKDLSTLSPFLLVYLPTASAVPPELVEPHYLCHLPVTDGLPSTLLTSLRLVDLKNSTPEPNLAKRQKKLLKLLLLTRSR